MYGEIYTCTYTHRWMCESLSVCKRRNERSPCCMGLTSAPLAHSHLQLRKMQEVLDRIQEQMQHGQRESCWTSLRGGERDHAQGQKKKKKIGRPLFMESCTEEMTFFFSIGSISVMNINLVFFKNTNNDNSAAAKVKCSQLVPCLDAPLVMLHCHLEVL